MNQPLVTIVVVPRESFAHTRRSLESLYDHTTHPFRLVYVDGASPPWIRRYLVRQSKEKAFELLRSNRFLSPNQARNMGLRRVSTPYVAFVDNDVLFAEGWLEALVRCAEETAAWIVGPLYCQEEPPFQKVHMAGGTAHFETQGAHPVFEEHHRFIERPLSEVRHLLKREPIEVIEFHTMLVRMDVFKEIGQLDEQMFSGGEHVDLCLSVRALGRAVYFEPAAMVNQLFPPSFPAALPDLPWFLRRWSDDWMTASVARFKQKWNLGDDDPWMVDLRRFAQYRRKLPFAIPLARLRRSLNNIVARR